MYVSSKKNQLVKEMKYSSVFMKELLFIFCHSYSCVIIGKWYSCSLYYNIMPLIYPDSQGQTPRDLAAHSTTLQRLLSAHEKDPPPLTQCCRLAIRSYLGPARLHVIPHLAAPQILLGFLQWTVKCTGAQSNVPFILIFFQLGRWISSVVSTYIKRVWPSSTHTSQNRRNFTHWRIACH